MNTEQKSTGKKKSYSKKISKKELLEQTIARKNAADRVAEGGVYIGANGVSVSSAAMEARQAALRAAGGGFAAPVDERQQRPSRHASPTVVRIEPASPQGDRLAHCLWNAQVLLLDVLKFDTAADKLVSRYLREHREFGPRDRHVVAETVFAVLRQKRLQRRFVQMPMADFHIAMQQHRHQLIVFGFQHRIGVHVHHIQRKTILRLIRLQGRLHVVAQAAILTKH